MFRATQVLTNSFLYKPATKAASKVIAALALCAVAAGCTQQYTADTLASLNEQAGLADQHVVIRSQNWVLPASSRIHVAKPITDSQQRLHNRVSQNLADVLRLHFAQTSLSSLPTAKDNGIGVARDHGADILIFPRLVVYSDSAGSIEEMDTAYVDYNSVATDKLALQLVMYDASNGMHMDTAMVYSNSRWASLFRRHPDDMLATAFDHYAKSITAHSVTQR